MCCIFVVKLEKNYCRTRRVVPASSSTLACLGSEPPLLSRAKLKTYFDEGNNVEALNSKSYHEKVVEEVEEEVADCDDDGDFGVGHLGIG